MPATISRAVTSSEYALYPGPSSMVGHPSIGQTLARDVASVQIARHSEANPLGNAQPLLARPGILLKAVLRNPGSPSHENRSGTRFVSLEWDWLPLSSNRWLSARQPQGPWSWRQLCCPIGIDDLLGCLLRIRIATASPLRVPIAPSHEGVLPEPVR